MGKIKKILENELVGGTQSTDVYPVTSVKAVYDENNERLDHILNRRGVVNVSTNYNDDHIAEVLTLEQAIAKVPSSDRVLGFQGNVLTADGWITYKFIGTSITQWSDTQYWAMVTDSSNLKQELGDSKTMAMSQSGIGTHIGTNEFEEFSPSITYKKGDYVIYNGIIYKFTKDKPASEWNAEYVVQTSLKGYQDNNSNKVIRNVAESVNDINVSAIPSDGDNDLELSDDKGNIILALSSGHIKTKNFGSEKLTEDIDNLEKSCKDLVTYVNDSGLGTANTTSKSDLDVADEQGNILAEFSQGEFKTKNFDTRESASAKDDFETSDLGIADEQGNTILKLENGEIKTKNFDSSEATSAVTTENGGDAEIADEHGNVLLRLSSGHIKTKNFDSSDLDNSDNEISLLKLKTSFDNFCFFDFDLTKTLSEGDKAKLFNITKGEISDGGLTIPIGYQNHIDYIDPIVFDDEKFVLDITKGSASDVVVIQSVGSASDDAVTNESYVLNHNSMSGVASKLVVDFSTGKLSAIHSNTISYGDSLGTFIKEVAFDTTGDDFVIEWGRKQRYVYATIYNVSTCNRYELIVIDEDYPNLGGSSDYNLQFRPAGWMYYTPSFYQHAGSTKFKRFRCYLPTNLEYLFQGDSYTQGHSGYYKNSWSHLCCELYGKSETAGVSGSKLLSCIEQYHKVIKGKIQVKNIVISIGINDAPNINAETISTWINKYNTYIEELINDGIHPIVNRIWSNNPTINNAIANMGYDGVDFSAINLHNSGLYVNGHLTEKGNLLSYNIFINQIQNFIL